ncbi:MAG: amino acid ABC transporter substrate-binding protein [Kineosporiaceae bacterium]|nr:amino acid ABC transporter substrate-binding protein [Kineosporiaceae bacterium]
MRTTRSLLVLLAGLTLTATACAPADSGSTSTGSGSASADACAKDALKLETAGTLTIGTDKPAYTPWFVDDTPSNGKGFESAVAYAIAEKLGFAASEVTWTVVKFDSLFSPKPTTFDFDINQISITDERAKVVDFSSGYYDVAQAVVATKTSPIAGATSLADLAKGRLGAAVGTTSYDAILNQIKPTTKPSAFPDNDKAKLALSNGQIDGLVVDLPTALYLAGVEIEGGVVVGQVPNAGGGGEQFGLLLEKDSPLTGCVTQAVDALRADGTLKKLETQWLTTSDGAKVLS